VFEVTPGEQELAHLAVSSIEEAAYRCLLLRPGLGEEALALTLDLPLEACRTLLQQLVVRGMVKVAAGGELTAVDPPVVVERLIEARLQELQKEMQRVLSSRHLIGSLLSSEREGWNNASAETLERIDGLDEVRLRIDELTFFTYSELLSVHPGPAWSPESIEATRTPDLRCLRRGIRMRTIVRAEAFDDPVTCRYLAELISRGAEVRSAHGALERILIQGRCVLAW
jgi:sugar-specific transcriptional regulator TrmB